MERKNNENAEWAKWANGIGESLIQKVQFTVGNTVLQTMRNCKKCKKTYEDPCDNDEATKLWREMRGKSGNLNVCYQCDEPNQ